ncbi:MAG: HutD family protein, partial [Rhodoferax sp.]|nr:HutD family protein [Rhodoferax sp.]
MAVHFFQRHTLPATPWKNGGGVTREIACQPAGAGLDQFIWRVSIASIAQSGPFSTFAGVDRVIMLLAGGGVRLTAADGSSQPLDTPLAPYAFAGETKLQCDLLAGASTDFNVMTRRSAVRAQVDVVRGRAELPAPPQGLLYVVSGAWQISGLPQIQALRSDHGMWWDTALP